MRHEMATTLVDVFARRTRAHLLDRAACLAAAPDVAALLGRELDWSADEVARQVADYRALCAAEVAAQRPRQVRRHDGADQPDRARPARRADWRPSRWRCPTGFVDRLAEITEVVTDVDRVADASRDWWPLALHWALAGEVPQRAAVVVRPATYRRGRAACSRCAIAARVPVTPAGGRSGVCGASVPVFGGVLLDTTGLDRHRRRSTRSPASSRSRPACSDPTSRPTLARRPRPDASATSRRASTSRPSAAGWPAAGPASTRRATARSRTCVVGLEVVLADGRVVRTGGAPAAATGPDLTQLFAGSEGTLGVITRVWLRAHPVPQPRRHGGLSFATLDDGFDACRRILRARRHARRAPPLRRRRVGARHAAATARRARCSCSTRATRRSSTPRSRSSTDECDAARRRRPTTQLVDDWLAHRNDTSALQALTRKGFVVDTMEIAAPWSRLSDIVRRRHAPP